jgi:50S ribosomal subunit-associated GTPase HflX
MALNVKLEEETLDMVEAKLEEELHRMNNTLNSFRSNNLTGTEAYGELQAEKREVQVELNNLRAQVRKAEREKNKREIPEIKSEGPDEPEGLGSLFS